MKLIPRNITAPRMDDGLGRGIDIALTVALFVVVGYGLDHWLGTVPWITIAMTVLAGVGFFARYKYQYDAAMERHEADRRELAQAGPTIEHQREP
jgi:F0F1-type ATP synthase assembly protein I